MLTKDECSGLVDLFLATWFIIIACTFRIMEPESHLYIVNVVVGIGWGWLGIHSLYKGK